MGTKMDILFKTEEFIFSYRVGGILIQDDKILLQRPAGDDYAIPGGHVAALSDDGFFPAFVVVAAQKGR